MMRPRYSTLLSIACLSAAAMTAWAQTARLITIEVRDGKTGAAITPSNVQVRFNRQPEIKGNWVDQKDDGTIEVNVPAAAKVIAVRVTYDDSTEYFVNCDVAKQKNIAADSWYPISDILASGLAIPNDCVRPKDVDKVKPDLKPGKLVLFVRKHNWKEQALE
jgi:hypothetical protein